MQCFLENDGVARNFHHVTVEHRIVFPQKISFIQTVTDHSDETAFGVHHASQVDGPDFQTLLAGAATRTAGVAHHRTDERIPSPVRGVLAVRNHRLFARCAFCARPNCCWAALAVAGGLLFGTVGAGFACALRPATTPATGFAPARLFRDSPNSLPAWVAEDVRRLNRRDSARLGRSMRGARCRGRRLLNAQSLIRGGRGIVAHRVHGVARVLDDAGTLGQGQARGQYANRELSSSSFMLASSCPSYFFTGGPGLLAGPAGSRSWLKYVVVRQVATTLSPGAY